MRRLVTRFLQLAAIAAVGFGCSAAGGADANIDVAPMKAVRCDKSTMVTTITVENTGFAEWKDVRVTEAHIAEELEQEKPNFRIVDVSGTEQETKRTFEIHARARRPFTGRVGLVIDVEVEFQVEDIEGSLPTFEGFQPDNFLNQQLTLSVAFAGEHDGCDAAVEPPPVSPPPSPRGCPLGDLVFVFLSDDGAGPPSDLATFADVDGGQVCGAVPGSLTGSQAWPSVSPDGQRIAYITDHAIVDPVGGEIESRFAVYVVPFDGSLDPAERQDARYVLATGNFAHLDWSPDGKWIAATEYFEDGTSKIVLIRASDGERFEAVDNPLWPYQEHPSWSPDQGTIYFASATGTNPAPSLLSVGVQVALDEPVFDAAPDLLINMGGTEPLILGINGVYDPDCSPDGTRIAFVNNELHGSEPARVTWYWLETESYTTDVSKPGAEEDYGDSNPTWWDDTTVVFQRRIVVGEDGGRVALFRRSDTEQAEITDEEGDPVPGSASMPAVVPAGAR